MAVKFRLLLAAFTSLMLSSALADLLTIRQTIATCRDGECRWRQQNGWFVPDENSPGTKPFVAPVFVEVETTTNMFGSVFLQIKGVASGKIHKFVGDWQSMSVIQTTLPDRELYRIHSIAFIPKGSKKGVTEGLSLLRIDGWYKSSVAEACSLDVRTGHPLHIVRGESERPVFLLKNMSDEAVSWSGELRLNDFLGHNRAIPFKASVPAFGTHQIVLPDVLPEKGVWLVLGDVHGDDGSAATPQTRFAVLDDHGAPQRLPSGKFRMGFNYHVKRYFPVCRTNCNAALMACGAKLVRIGLGSWREAQPRSPDEPYDWLAEDRLLDEMHSIGCDVHAGCWGIPAWAADQDILERAKKENDWKVWAMIPPRDTQRLETYLEAAARHFGNSIAYWEVGNEWDLPFFFPGTTEDAVRGLSAAGRALHRGCPDVPVSTCGWADSGDNHKAIRNKGIQSNLLVRCKGDYDVHAVHLHGVFKDFRHRLSETFALRKACDVTAPWYADETAVSTYHAGGELPAAENVWKKILFAWANGSTDYIWYNLRATGWDANDPEQGYGVITPDFYPRASFAAFSALSKTFSGFDSDGIVCSEKTRECFRFKGVRDGRPERIIAGWEIAPKNKTRPVRVKTDAERAYVVDLMGNAIELRVENGVCDWPFGSSPSALRLAGATTADPVDDDIRAMNLPPKAILVGHDRDRPGDLTVATADQVHSFFEATPGMTHRLWKGPKDCAFRAWFDASDGDLLTVTVKVSDDVHTQHAERASRMSQGDCVRIDFEVKGQNGTWFLGFRRTEAGVSEPHIWGTPTGFDAEAIRARIGLETARKNSVTTYIVRIPMETMGLGPDPFDGHVSVSLKVDDADAEDRDLWIGLEECYKMLRK